MGASDWALRMPVKKSGCFLVHKSIWKTDTEWIIHFCLLDLWLMFFGGLFAKNSKTLWRSCSNNPQFVFGLCLLSREFSSASTLSNLNPHRCSARGGTRRRIDRKQRPPGALRTLSSAWKSPFIALCPLERLRITTTCVPNAYRHGSTHSDPPCFSQVLMVLDSGHLRREPTRRRSLSTSTRSHWNLIELS